MIDGKIEAKFEQNCVVHQISIDGTSDSLPYDLSEFITVILEYSGVNVEKVIEELSETFGVGQFKRNE